MPEVRLTYTSYIVLGLLGFAREATPYDMKVGVAATLGNFWSIPHTQLYTEPERLAAAGYVRERREEGGRRRKLYSLTDKGRRALEEWQAEPTEELSELRDPGLLKLFFGADPARLARARLQAHKKKLAEYERRRELDPGHGPRGAWLALDAGVGHEREWVRFWSQLARRARP